MTTKRQQIIELLKQGRWTSLELSAQLHISERDVFDHLEHVKKTLSNSHLAGSIIASPYACLSCGYVFKKRSKFDRPGRCPQCRQSHIRMAEFSLL